jgi:hypothetical protein
MICPELEIQQMHLCKDCLAPVEKRASQRGGTSGKDLRPYFLTSAQVQKSLVRDACSWAFALGEP